MTTVISRVERIILAALDRGPLYHERHAGCGWYFPTPHLTHRFGERPRRRYFRTMDVRRLIARGLATQIGSQLVRVNEQEATVTTGSGAEPTERREVPPKRRVEPPKRRVEVLICEEWVPATESSVEEPDYFVYDLERPARNGQTEVCVRVPVPEWRVRVLHT